MTWPDTYKDRFEAAQRALRIIHERLKAGDAGAETLGPALAADPEAAIEYAEATGTGDLLERELDRALKGGGADHS